MKYKECYCFPHYSEGDKSYHGFVKDTPDISIIETPNLEAFEKELHQRIIEYLEGLFKRKYELYNTILLNAGLYEKNRPLRS